MPHTTQPLAFLSYVHADDEVTRGGVTLLHRGLSQLVNAVGTTPFEIFLDKEGVQWGQDWQKEIKDALECVVFFIPVISPRFFNSGICREELECFIRREEQLGRNDLIYPIYYFESGLDDPDKLRSDALLEVIAKHSWADWRELWMELREDSRKVQSMLLLMATRLRRAAGQLKLSSVLSEPNFSGGTRSDLFNVSASPLSASIGSGATAALTQRSAAIVFTHFSLPSDDEWIDVESNVSEYVSRRWHNTLCQLNLCSTIKLVYIFLSEAYTSFMSMASEQILMASSCKEYRIREELDNFINNNALYNDKFCVVGLNELIPVIDELRPLTANRGTPLDQLVLGGGARLNYDAPKFVEAIIRLARRDRQEPIFRVDEDVIVNDEAISALLNTFFDFLNKRKKYFLFSGTYGCRQHARNLIVDENTRHLLNDYAVRVHFLSSPQGLGRRAAESGYTLDKALAHNFLNTLRDVGADVSRQPISGAGFCISARAIVQLPPFANLARNVVWIDDSIKWALHVGIDDLAARDMCTIAGACFEQTRYPNNRISEEDMQWATKVYLPRLVYGCIIYGLTYDFVKYRPCPFAKAVAQYMLRSQPPTRDDFLCWGSEASLRVMSMWNLWTGRAFRVAAGKSLSEFANDALDLNKPGCRDIIAHAVNSEKIPDVEKLCDEEGIDMDRNAGAYIGQAIADLRRYFELLEHWPFIVRAIDFMMREQDNPAVYWLGHEGLSRAPAAGGGP